MLHNVREVTIGLHNVKVIGDLDKNSFCGLMLRESQME